MRIDDVTKDIEKNIDLVLRPPNYRKITTAKIPTWAMSDGSEGLEIIDGQIRSFWYKDGNRDYTQPGNVVFEEIKRSYAPKQQEQKTEQVPAEQANGEKNLTAIIPDELTMPLLEKWKEMSTFKRMLMFQKTNPENIEERKGRGGKMFKYVKGNFMEQEANIAFLFSWSSEIGGWHLGQDGVACYGSVSVEIDGKLQTKSAVGIDVQEFSAGDKTKPVFTIAEMMKNAHTDMKKKGFAALGFNGDVYRGEV